MRSRSLRMFMTAVAAGVVVPLAACSASVPASGGSGDAYRGDSWQTRDGVEQAGSRSSESAARQKPGRSGADAKRRDGEQSGGERGGGEQPDAGRAATLTGIELRAGDSTYDRVVFHFADSRAGERLPEYDVEYLGGYPHAPGSGKPVEMEGQSFLGVSFTHATADGSVPEILDADLPTVAEVRYLGGFEKVQEAAIGVSSCHGAPERSSFDVEVRGSDVVVDVRAADCGSQQPVTRECGDVAFEPASESGAFGITATGVGCDLARDVAAFAEGPVGDRYGTPSGFSCLPERDDDELTPSVLYTCTRGEATVEFTTG